MIDFLVLFLCNTYHRKRRSSNIDLRVIHL
jgi:hypothetical protein